MRRKSETYSFEAGGNVSMPISPAAVRRESTRRGGTKVPERAKRLSDHDTHAKLQRIELMVRA